MTEQSLVQASIRYCKIIPRDIDPAERNYDWLLILYLALGGRQRKRRRAGGMHVTSCFREGPTTVPFIYTSPTRENTCSLRFPFMF